MHIPSPAELGLPEKFERLRPPQVEALRLLLTSRKRVKALCGPTGFGKTLVYIMYALITGKATGFITESRALQDQLMKDFESVGLVDLRGRRNYPCDLQDGMTCEGGYAARCSYKGTVNCPASAAEMRAATSRLVVTNYDKWTASRKFGTGLQHLEQLVLDEGHSAPDAVARAMQVVLNHKEIEDTLGLDFLSGTAADELVNWREWAQSARQEAESAMHAAKRRLDEAGANAKQAWARQYLHLRNLTKRLATIATANPQHWIVDGTKEGFQFDPIRPGKYAEAVLFLRVPSVLVVSATLRPKTLFMLGVAKEQFDYKEFDSDFDPARCPIYFIPTQRVDSKTLDLSMLWLRLDQIAARRTDRKGIVHTISYARRDEILGRSRFAPHMLINQQGEAATELIEQYKAAQAGTILVSPAVGAGYDFPGRECEWQFVCKIPFPDGRNKIVKARTADDKEYGAYQAMNKLVQIFGRGMRSQEDLCENFIGDNHCEWFIPRYKHLAPKSFHMFYKTVSVIPPPPARL